ncbi:hypothetical protein SHLO109777_14685 [Shewanella loihica]|jgi:hypothetical protein|uniref:DUF2489 domain-containing protein n=1 Tax=Shewanella loihica (strain ATCC BAA-1088 / PV-4) TaxID=323850 RepID=A3QJN8_SHELP|nr:hypothetical protein [Shewanella loihica]ABO25686.1 hypothetical protein Shew_3820 [Shewanella loihica PV-4]
MDWTVLLGSGVLGALLTKVLDTLWLQKVLQSAEKRKWLREKRLKAYSDLAAELLTLGRKSDLRENAFDGYAIAAEAIVLTDDDALALELEEFFTWLANMYKEASVPEHSDGKRSEEELAGAYKMLYAKSRRLVKELRESLLKG